MIIGKASRRTFTLGDRVRVKVLRASLEQKLLDYQLLEKLEAESPVPEVPKSGSGKGAGKSGPGKEPAGRGRKDDAEVAPAGKTVAGRGRKAADAETFDSPARSRKADSADQPDRTPAEKPARTRKSRAEKPPVKAVTRKPATKAAAKKAGKAVPKKSAGKKASEKKAAAKPAPKKAAAKKAAKRIKKAQ
jgi:hypothetical protein